MSFEMNGMNSISGFNKIFQQNLGQINTNIQGADEFQNIFDSIQQNSQNNALKGSVQFNAGDFFGADAISAQKVENLSDSAKMVKDIGNAFGNGLTNLNTTQKESEAAFETFATGGDISIHEVMIASQKSSLSMQMALQLRNQLINTYTQLQDTRI